MKVGYGTDRRCFPSEVYDAAFVWLERKDLRTPSREFRTLLQSYRTSDAGMLLVRLLTMSDRSPFPRFSGPRLCRRTL